MMHSASCAMPLINRHMSSHKWSTDHSQLNKAVLLHGQVFSLINAIIDRLGDSVKPFAQGLMQLLPAAWEAAEGHSLLRMQILVSLQKLVHAMGLDSWACYPLLMHLLPHCTDVHQVELPPLPPSHLAMLYAPRIWPPPKWGSHKERLRTLGCLVPCSASSVHALLTAPWRNKQR